MVRVVDDDGVPVEPVVLEALNGFPDGPVHVFDRSPVLGVSLSHLGNVRMIRSENHFGRIFRFLAQGSESAGFMTVSDIEYGEERLSILALFPSACVISPGIVPEILGVSATQVVVGLRAVAREVTGLLQLFVVEADEGGDLKSAAHGLRPVGNRVHSGDPRRTGRGADRPVVETVQVAETLLGQLVDMGSLGILGPVTTDPFDAVVFAGDPENVGFLFFSRKRMENGECKGKKSKFEQKAVDRMHGFLL